MRRVLFAVLLTVAGCTSNATFTPSSRFSEVGPRPKGRCIAPVLDRLPRDKRYVEIGFCTVGAAPMMPSSTGTAHPPPPAPEEQYSPAAVRHLQDCACDNGGNAIVLRGEIGSESREARIRPYATVLYIFPEGR